MNNLLTLRYPIIIGRKKIISPLLNSLVSYWKYDENSGNAVGDSKGSNTGAWSGTLGSQWTPGKINSGGNFNGSDNGVNCGNDISLQLSVFTYAGWVKTSTSGTICSWVNNAGPQFRIGGTLHLDLLQSNISNIASSTGAVPSGVFAHVAVTYDASGNWAFYINGSLSGSGTNAQGFSFSSNFYHGRQLTGEYLNGVLDELGVWSRALSASEIAQLYNSGLGKQYPFS